MLEEGNAACCCWYCDPNICEGVLPSVFANAILLVVTPTPVVVSLLLIPFPLLIGLPSFLSSLFNCNDDEVVVVLVDAIESITTFFSSRLPMTGSFVVVVASFATLEDFVFFAFLL